MSAQTALVVQPDLPLSPPAVGSASLTLSSSVRLSQASPLTLPTELLCFRAAQQVYGLPLDSIQEIRSYQQALPLPGQDSAVLGVLDLRGQVIALLDLRQLLRLPPAPAHEAGLRAVIVLVQGTRRLGLVVDEVQDVLQATAEALRLLPQLPGDFAHRHLRGLVSADADRQVLVLDPQPWMDRHATASTQ